MNYNPTNEVEIKEASKTANAAILKIVSGFLNVDKELFDIKELTNDQVVQTDSLIPDTALAKGVMQIKEVGLGQTMEDTFIKKATFTLLLPLTSRNDIFINAIEKAVLNLNRQIFETPEDTIIFDSVSVMDSNRLPEAIDGVEYELVYLEAQVRCSDTLMMSTEQHITINKQRLKGVISIIYSAQKTTDGIVSTDPIQKNTTNGIQVSITISLELSKSDPLHKKLFLESDQDINYNVEYYTGYSDKPKAYAMKVSNFTGNNIIGDSVKAQIVFSVGDS